MPYELNGGGREKQRTHGLDHEQSDKEENGRGEKHCFDGAVHIKELLIRKVGAVMNLLMGFFVFI
jgi:hypothetical protein